MDLHEVVVITLASVGYTAALLWFLVDEINRVVFWLRSVELPGRVVRTYERHIGTDESGREYIITMSEVEFETSDGSIRRLTGQGKRDYQPGGLWPEYSYTVRYDPRTGNSMLAEDLRSTLITGSIIVTVGLALGAMMAFLLIRHALA